MDAAAVRLRELVEPDEGALRDHHDLRHPVEVRAEALRLLVEIAAEARNPGRVAARSVRLAEEPFAFLFDEVPREQEPPEELGVEAPLVPHELQLREERARCVTDGR